MKIWVGVTDGDWFEFLRARQPDEVNFWQPSGSRRSKLLQPGEPFLFKLQGPHLVPNGLLLRSDLHTLFDRGYVTVTPDLRTEVSKRIREEFENGRDYYAHHGKRLTNLPAQPQELPAPCHAAHVPDPGNGPTPRYRGAGEV